MYVGYLCEGHFGDLARKVQIDFIYVVELTNYPILFAKDLASRFRNVGAVSTNEIYDAERILEKHLVAVNRAPIPISFDQKLDNDDFCKMFRNHGIKPKHRLARRHKKIGSMESALFVKCHYGFSKIQ